MWLLCCEQHPWDPPHCPVIVPTGLRGTTDWSISYPTSLQRERDLALNKALCGKTNDIGLVLDHTFHKPHSHFCKQFTIMRCISVWFLVCVTIQQDHNCICIFSTLKKKKKDIFQRLLVILHHLCPCHTQQCYIVFTTATQQLHGRGWMSEILCYPD